MKWSGVRNLPALFKQYDILREYFNRKYKNLVKFYLRFYRRRHHTVVGNVLKFRDGRAVIEHNVLRIKGGLSARRQKSYSRHFYGFPITTRPTRNLKKKKKKKEKLPLQLQNVSSTTLSTATYGPLAGFADGKNGQKPASTGPPISNANSEKPPAENGTSISRTAETSPPNNELDENSTNNIWNMDLGAVALEMTDENLKSIDDDETDCNTNGTTANNISIKEPVSTSTPILKGNRSLFPSPADRTASPVEDINEKLRRQLKLLKMGKTEKPVKAPETPIITRISLRRNTIAVEPAKLPLKINKPSPIEIGKKSASHDTSPQNGTNETRNSTDEIPSSDKDTTSKSKITGRLIDSLFNRLKSFGEKQSEATTATATTAIGTRSANKRRSDIPVSDTTPAKIGRTSLDQAPKAGAACTSLTVREMLQIKRMQEQDQQDDDDNVSTCSSSEFLGFDMTNKNIDVSALLPTPRVPKSSKESVFVSKDLDAFMKENSLENVANVEIVVPAKVGDVDEALITDSAQPPTLTIPERPIDMQRPRTLAEKRMILQRQKDVHYQMIEHESTVYHELKKRVKMGSFYRNPLRSIQDAEIPFTRDCWRATCWINTDNNYFFYRTIACGGSELKLAGGRGNNRTKLFCTLPEDIDDVKSNLKPGKCKCPSIGRIKINNYEEHRQAIAERGIGTSFTSVKKLNNLKREYVRPCPLSKKPRVAKRTSLDIEYGQMELLTMPTVQLEVWPKIGEPLPDTIKPLMKTIMPDGNLITAEWAQFAVSVVVAPKPDSTSRPQKQQRKFKRPAPEERKSFIFDIPYVNNQTRIIVRRRRHPNAIKGAALREPIEAFYDSNAAELEFTKNVDRSDEVSADCADALSAMIESVAVTINENNFIRDDPDLDYVGKIVSIKPEETETVKTENDSKLAPAIDSTGKDKIASTAKMDKGTSKLKVMKELKRLNVTIINAVPDEKPKSEVNRAECKKTICRLGCVCDSITQSTPMPNRCSNIKCMFACKCSSSANQPHFNVPVDLLNKDLGNLHARATARLAKEEKDFTSTIVVSDHDMFVLPNSVRSSKRNTKKPKRYNECLANYDSSEDQDTLIQSPPAPKRSRHAPSSEHAYDQSIIDSMRHVAVEVNKLPELDVEGWCMVHCLYKCYCDMTAVIGKPFSFTAAGKTGTVDASLHHVVDETTTPASHWESIPPRRRQYSFDRSGPVSSKTVAPISESQTNFDIAQQRTLRAARTRMFRWQIERKRRSVLEVRELRRQCEELEVAYRDYLNNRIDLCKQHFLREAWKQRTLRENKGQPTDDVTFSDDIQFIAQPRVPATYAKKPETSVTQLNRIITNTMRTVCAIQRRSILKLNPEPCKISIVRWDRILTAFNEKEVFVWDAQLTDDSTVLLLTNDASEIMPVSLNIKCATNITDRENDKLPLLAKMLKMAVKNDETTQLAVLLFRLSTFWRIVGVMHSDKRYIQEGLHASPSAEENPALTHKIDQLHKLLIQRQKQETAQANVLAQAAKAPVRTPLPVVPPVAPKVTTVTPTAVTATDVVTARSNLTLENLQNMNESQLQMLLPIPLSKDQRWLMMTLGTDFTHIWLPQWRKFLSHKRIRSALVYAAQSKKTIELSPPDCHPSVFVTNVRKNQIFVGPYHMNEPQKLALFYRHADGRMLLSENYAKLPNIPPFLRRSIGSWIYTSQNAAATTDTEKSKADATPANVPTTASVHNVNVQKPTSHLKIQNVYSIGSSMATKEAGQSILKPISMQQNASINKPTVIRILNQPSTEASIANATASMLQNASINKPTVIRILNQPSTEAQVASTSASIANAAATSKPIIITKVSNQSQKMPVIASIRSYGEEVMGKLPVISSIRSGEEVQQSLIGASISSAKPSTTASETSSEPFTLVEVVPIVDTTSVTSESQSRSESTSPSNGPMEIIDLSDDDDEAMDESNCENDNIFAGDPTSYGRVTGYIICPTNKDLGKIPAEIVGNSITLRIGSCDKEAELPLNLEGNGSFDSLGTVDKYMSQLITNIAYSVHPKNLLLKWKFCAETSDEHRQLPIHSTRALNSYSVVFNDISLSLQSNYRARTDLRDSRKYILDVEKLASQILPRNVAKECQLKDVIEKAREMAQQLEGERVQLAALKDRYSRMISAKVKIFRMLQAERKAVARAHGPE